MKRVFIDMDDTICDFIGPFKNNQFKIKYPQSKLGFFLDLEPLEYAIEAVNILCIKYDVWFLTRPSIKNTNCYTEKAEWIKRYFGENMLEKLIICPNKSLVKGDYLIDDDHRHGQPKFEGKWIQFGSKEYKDWKTILDYLMK